MMRHFFILLFIFTVFTVSAVRADEPQLIASHEDWNVYSYMEGGSKVCYMASKPAKAEGNYSKRGDIFALLTNRPADGTKDVFSYITGYGYKPGSEVSVEIDGKKYLLFTQDDTAWAPDAETDQRLTQAIQAGSKMVVKGTSSRGTVTTDTFGLRGSSAAHERMNKECAS